MGKAESCQLLQVSLDRFYSRAFPGQISSRSAKSICGEDGTCSNYFGGMLHQVNVTFTRRNGCEHFPHEKMDESCKYAIMYINENFSYILEIHIKIKITLIFHLQALNNDYMF